MRTRSLGTVRAGTHVVGTPSFSKGWNPRGRHPGFLRGLGPETECPCQVCARSVAQVCPTLCDPMDCSPPGSSGLGFSRQECWSGLPRPPPGDLPDPGMEARSPPSPALQPDSSPAGPPVKPVLCKKRRLKKRKPPGRREAKQQPRQAAKNTSFFAPSPRRLDCRATGGHASSQRAGWGMGRPASPRRKASSGTSPAWSTAPAARGQRR